ncbi:MAG: FmdB family zinc ribbon protein [Anaerolineae bacterium]
MPLYQYECTSCGESFERRRRFNDAGSVSCPNGHDTTRRVLSAPAIVFKGSGFYVNDSRSGHKKGKDD